MAAAIMEQEEEGEDDNDGDDVEAPPLKKTKR